MRRTVIIPYTFTRVLVKAAGEVQLKMTKTRVKLEFDGHPITLNVDSASPYTTVVSGDWYEHLYGKGSCKYVVSGCYFCPASDPCNLETLSKGKLEKIGFVDGHVVGISIREVTLKIGRALVHDFKVGLIINSTRVQNNKQPFGLLGLSANSKLDIKPTLVHQLVYAGVVTRKAFAFRVVKYYQGITGALVVGGGSPPNEAESKTITLPLWVEPEGTLAVNVTSAEFVTQTAKESIKIEFGTERKYPVAVLDTGSGVTVLNKELFVLMVRATESEFGVDNVDFTTRPSKKDFKKYFASLSWTQIKVLRDAAGIIWIRKELVARLPMMRLQLNHESHIYVIRLHLRNHVGVCVEVWCSLMVVDGPSVGILPHQLILLGKHFFLEYDTHFDLDRRLVSFSVPQRPVKVKYQSLLDFESHNHPACREIVERETGISWLVRKCFGAS
ncbi:hypothetical protein FOL47_009314 [Perkinsus chesapeaki]|uniref:Peptidase A1 domain-containing protein n=1 Tax=Perkinsus chesapeaki TaxID=330153 RepID=A0A7J6L961_PERCH|nr:hypothetical protein FOL47_009314 [Perkinsus chesapeaki]